MEKKERKVKFGDFLLKNGEYSPVMPEDISDFRGIYLIDGVSLIDVSDKRKMYRKADDWCADRGGVIPSNRILYFILMHLNGINRIRERIDLPPISQGLLAWSNETITYDDKSVTFNYALDFSTKKMGLLISSSSLLDDCATANVICVVGEPYKRHII